MEYAFTAHRDGISSFINQHAFITELDRQTKDIGVFNLGIWGIFFRPLAGGKTILKNIFRKAGGINRPKTREIVESWKSMTPAVMVLEDVKEGMIHFEDVMTKNNSKWKWTSASRIFRRREA